MNGFNPGFPPQKEEIMSARPLDNFNDFPITKPNEKQLIDTIKKLKVEVKHLNNYSKKINGLFR